MSQYEIAGQYHRELKDRPAKNVLPSEYADIGNFLKASLDPLDKFNRSSIGNRFNSEIRSYLPESLAKRAEQVFSAVLALSEWRNNSGENGLQIPDADTIQQWVLQLIEPGEFTMFVSPAFTGWADRLTDGATQVPHIAQANQFIAEKISQRFKDNRQQKVKGVDLGSGTGATMLSVIDALQRENIKVDISGVDLTPYLVQKAKENTGKNVEAANMLDWLKKQKDESLDFITTVYAVHHLSYKDQLELQQCARKKLKRGGILAIADPTGRSPFNLQNLDINEPEAVMACFRPDVGEVAESLKGFRVNTSQEDKDKTQVESFGVKSSVTGNVLDQGTLGYALLATKK